MAEQGNEHKAKKSLWEIVKFLLVSCLVSIIQLVLVNALYFGMQGWTAPLPAWLAGIFSEQTMGARHSNWGYVLPFFLSNLIANVYGYFQNRATTFKAKNVPKWCLAVYLVVLFALILFCTWLQGVVVNGVQTLGVTEALAPTIAMMVAGAVQFAVLFPLEKFVLFKPRP